MSVTVEWTTCNRMLSRCMCAEPPDHAGPCVCDCTGSWEHHDDGTVTVHAWPCPPPSGDPLIDLAKLAAYADLPDLPWTAPLYEVVDPPFRARRGAIRFIRPPDLAAEVSG